MNDYQNPPPPTLVADPAVLLKQVLVAATEAYAASFDHQRMVERREVSDPTADLAGIQAEIEAVLARNIQAHSDLAALTDQHLLSYCQQAEGAEDVLQAVRLIVGQVVPIVHATDQAVQQALEQATFETLIAQSWDTDTEPDEANDQDKEGNQL